MSCLSEDGKTLITGAEDGQIKIFRRKNSKEKFDLKRPFWTRITVQISNDRNSIFTGFRDHTIRVWNKIGQSFESISLYNNDNETSKDILFLNDSLLVTTATQPVVAWPYSLPAFFLESIENWKPKLIRWKLRFRKSKRASRRSIKISRKN